MSIRCSGTERHSPQRTWPCASNWPSSGIGHGCPTTIPLPEATCSEPLVESVSREDKAGNRYLLLTNINWDKDVQTAGGGATARDGGGGSRQLPGRLDPITRHARGVRSTAGCGWMEYCNGATQTDPAQLRRMHGHDDPHGVKYWSIGNETGWQYSPEEYAHEVRRFGFYLRQAQPDARLIACGDNRPDSTGIPG